MKILFKLTFKRDAATSLLEHNCFDYFFRVLFVNIFVWILLWILIFFSALSIFVKTKENTKQSRFIFDKI